MYKVSKTESWNSQGWYMFLILRLLATEPMDLNLLCGKHINKNGFIFFQHFLCIDVFEAFRTLRITMNAGLENKLTNTCIPQNRTFLFCFGDRFPLCRLDWPRAQRFSCLSPPKCDFS